MGVAEEALDLGHVRLGAKDESAVVYEPEVDRCRNGCAVALEGDEQALPVPAKTGEVRPRTGFAGRLGRTGMADSFEDAVLECHQPARKWESLVGQNRSLTKRGSTLPSRGVTRIGG